MKSFNLFAALLLSFVLGTGLVLAQSDRGTIRGTVTDPTGAVVPNARVILTGTETGEEGQLRHGNLLVDRAGGDHATGGDAGARPQRALSGRSALVRYPRRASGSPAGPP